MKLLYRLNEKIAMPDKTIPAGLMFVWDEYQEHFYCINPYYHYAYKKHIVAGSEFFTPCEDDENELIKIILDLPGEDGDWHKGAHYTYIREGIKLLTNTKLKPKEICEMLDEIYCATINMYQ